MSMARKNATDSILDEPNIVFNLYTIDYSKLS